MKLLSPVLGCFVLSVVFRISTCYPGGAPGSACNTMIPNHGVQPETSTPPYGIQLSATTYCGNSTVTVTLAGTSQGTEFKGFLCQPRTNPNTYETVGTFSQQASTTNNCGNNAALTHTNRNPKTSVQFTWTPDSSVKETVHIVCTVVQEQTKLWTQIRSSITYAGDSQCQSSGGLPTTCSGNEECENAVSMSVCQQGACVCPSDRKLANPTDTNCSPKMLDDDCMNDNDCMSVTNSKCIGGTCGCPVAGFVEVKNSANAACVATSLPVTCTNDEDCDNEVAMSVCKSAQNMANYCACPSNLELLKPNDKMCSTGSPVVFSTIMWIGCLVATLFLI